VCCGTATAAYFIAAIAILVNVIPAYFANNGVDIRIQIIAIEASTGSIGITVSIAIRANQAGV
jgi:hypothetical protein